MVQNGKNAPKPNKNIRQELTNHRSLLVLQKLKDNY
jgi:hypothetical protein